MRNIVLDSEYYKAKFIEKSNRKHNNKYDYKLVNYINSLTKVEVICKEHGSFFIRPDAHVRKVGCPECNGGIRYNNDVFIKKANDIHNFKYDYSLVNYKNSISKVKIICEIHGIFEMSPRNHLMGQNCPSCSGVKKKTNDDFIRESSIIHNYKYDYSSCNYVNNTKKVELICKEHGSFYQSPKDHLNGCGCQKCSNFSNGEKIIEEILYDIGISYNKQYKFDDCLSKNNVKLPFDFYLPDINILIEYDGRQHFEPVSKFGGVESFLNLRENDNRRNKWCEEKGIDLIRISYKSQTDDINRLLKIINSKINSSINNSNLQSSVFDVSSIISTKKEFFIYINEVYKGDIVKNYKIDKYNIDFYLPNIETGFIILSNYKNSEIKSNSKTQKLVSEIDNIKVIQIFEDLWINKKNIVKYRIKNILKLNNKVGSRRCKIINVNTKESVSFLNENHLQGAVGSTVKIGLEYNGEIVSIMTFGKNRKNLGSINKDNEWELIRFCNKGGLSVIGSASKLFNHFIKNWNPKKVISYADKLWSNGENVYEKIGMTKIHESKPSYFYLLGNKRVGRFSLRKDILVSMGFPEDLSEREICLSNGTYRIYDAGSIRYEWNSN